MPKRHGPAALAVLQPEPATHASDAVHSAGPPAALAALRVALSQGLRAVALGCSITASLGGCFGSGCAGPHSMAPMRPAGYLHDLMERVNASHPSARHSLANLGKGGSEGRWELGCMSSLVPDGAVDLVVLDFAIVSGVTDAVVDNHRRLLWALRQYSQPPFVLLLLNFYWCLDHRGVPANTLLLPGGRAAQTAFCRDEGDDASKVAKAQRLQNTVQRRLEAVGVGCGAAVLAIFPELAPRCGRA